VERSTYTKTWQVEGGPVLKSDGGAAVQKLSPIIRGTTAELEARHSQLDEILVGLLNEATANKGQAPAAGSVTLTSQRVTKSQPQVKQFTETSTLLKTEQKVAEPPSSTVDRQSSPPRRRTPDDVAVNGPPSRPAVSDTEDSKKWLDDQRLRLEFGRRSGWRARNSQVVSELRTRARTHSESEMDTAGLPRRGRRSEPANYRQSDRYDVKPARYVSGVERRPFTTQQTMYTFGVSPQRTTSLDHGLYDSPPVPERNESSREAMARQRRAQGM